MIVVASVLTGSVYGAYSSDLGSRHVHTIVVARKRQQLVLLQREVHTYVQVNILSLNRSYRETYFKTLIGHRTDVCQQLVVSERRHWHVVRIEHVGSLRVVILSSKHQSVMPQSYLSTDIECRLCLPHQIGVVIAYCAERHRWRIIHGNDARLLYIVHCGVGRDSTEIARTSVTGSQLQCVDAIKITQEAFLLDIPFSRYRREESPSMVVAHHRRTVATHGKRQLILII